MGIDFLAVGDTVVDDFIHFSDARIDTDPDQGDQGFKEICFRFGDKVPFDSSTKIYGVGNAANAAVAAARLGLKTAFVATIGKDLNGDLIVKHFKEEKVATTWVKQQAGAPTNYHYVLWYGDERTILVNHFAYTYTWPTGVTEPKTLYLSSLASGTEAYHDAIAEWLIKHPKVRFAFQPGTFQMKLGADKLKKLYARTDVFFANKEEYQRILNITDTDEKTLMTKMRALGPKTPILTDGRNGSYALDGEDFFHLPMYSDPAPPKERTGAGDAFASTTAAYLTMGMSLKDAMRRGLVNSAYVVQDIGAQAGLLKKNELESKIASTP